MSCGETSVALLKGYIELASSYALQGLWPQVEEKIASANEVLRKTSRVSTPEGHAETHRLAIAAAERVACVYSTLRTHIIRNNGQVLKSYVKEVMVALVQLPSHTDDERDSKFASSLHTYFTSFKDRDLAALKQTDYVDSYFADGRAHSKPKEDKTDPK